MYEVYAHSSKGPSIRLHNCPLGSLPRGGTIIFKSPFQAYQAYRGLSHVYRDMYVFYQDMNLRDSRAGDVLRDLMFSYGIAYETKNSNK